MSTADSSSSFRASAVDPARVRAEENLMSESLLDSLPDSWRSVWSAHIEDFDAQFQVARRADVSRLRLDVPGPLTTSDVNRVRRIAARPSIVHLDAADSATVQRVIWARWWTFEDAVQDALTVSDFLAFAGAMRAWCEELAYIEAVSALVAGGGNDLQTAVRALASRGTDDPAEPVELGVSAIWSREMVGRLHTFVHPNLMGHDSALHPERGRLFVTALDALALVSRRAGKLGLPVHSGHRIDSAVVPPALRDQSVLLEKVFDGLNARRVRAGRPALPDDFRRAVVARAHVYQEPRDDLDIDFTRDPVRLVAASAQPSTPIWEWRPELGFIQDPAGRASLGAAITAWDDLASALGRLTADESAGATPSADYLSYLVNLSNAAVLVLGVKKDLLVQSLTRALLRDNPLSIGLAARGLLEHHASVLRAGHDVRRAQVRLKKASDGSAQQASAFKAQEMALLRLLVGVSGDGTVHPLLEARAAALRATPLALGPMVGQSFELTDETAVREIWERLSELVHGNTGALNPPGAAANQGVTQIGLTVLTEMAEFARDLNVLAVFSQVIPVLESSLASLESGSSLRAGRVVQGVPRHLVHGRDYVGTGTREDPYRLLVGHHVDAYHPLLEQLGVVDHRRVTVLLEGFGIADEVTHSAGRIYVAQRRVYGQSVKPTDSVARLLSDRLVQRWRPNEGR